MSKEQLSISDLVYRSLTSCFTAGINVLCTNDREKSTVLNLYKIWLRIDNAVKRFLVPSELIFFSTKLPCSLAVDFSSHTNNADYSLFRMKHRNTISKHLFVSYTRLQNKCITLWTVMQLVCFNNYVKLQFTFGTPLLVFVSCSNNL